MKRIWRGIIGCRTRASPSADDGIIYEVPSVLGSQIAILAELFSHAEIAGFRDVR